MQTAHESKALVITSQFLGYDSQSPSDDLYGWSTIRSSCSQQSSLENTSPCSRIFSHSKVLKYSNDGAFSSFFFFFIFNHLFIYVFKLMRFGGELFHCLCLHVYYHIIYPSFSLVSLFLYYTKWNNAVFVFPTRFAC